MRAHSRSLITAAFLFFSLSCQWIAGVEKKELPDLDAGFDLDVVSDEAVVDTADQGPDMPEPESDMPYDGMDVMDIMDVHETRPDPDATDTGDMELPDGLKGLGESCTDPDECASLNCVDDVCCDTQCNTELCQRCDDYSHLGTGHCGFVDSSAVDPDDDCSHSECLWGRCNGNGYLCGYYTEGKQECGLCKSCDGATSTACKDIVYGEDEYAECGGASCCGFCDGEGDCAYVDAGTECTSPGDPCVELHYACDGDGACTAPLDPAGDRCESCPSSYATCLDVCVDSGFDGCLSADWHPDDDDCSDSVPSDVDCTTIHNRSEYCEIHEEGSFDCHCGNYIYD